MGAILYKTKSFDSLFDFLKKFDYKKLKKKLQCAKNDLIIYVHNGWNDIEIEVFAKVDFWTDHKRKKPKERIWTYYERIKSRLYDFDKKPKRTNLNNSQLFDPS